MMRETDAGAVGPPSPICRKIVAAEVPKTKPVRAAPEATGSPALPLPMSRAGPPAAATWLGRKATSDAMQ